MHGGLTHPPKGVIWTDIASLVASLPQAVKRRKVALAVDAWRVDSPSEGVLWTGIASLVDPLRQAVKRVGKWQWR
jgi:hypothetical protein